MVLSFVAAPAYTKKSRLPPKRPRRLACADDTKGQTCFICMEGVERRHAPNEGLVRGCACRGTAGVAHLSCLARQAEIAVDDDPTHGREPLDTRFARWNQCRLCGQYYTKTVRCALGWACWKTYLSRDDPRYVKGSGGFGIRALAMNTLGGGLVMVRRHKDALNVFNALWMYSRSLGIPEAGLINIHANMARCYGNLGLREEQLTQTRRIFKVKEEVFGTSDKETILEAVSLSRTLLETKGYAENATMLRRMIPAATRSIGRDHYLTLKLRWYFACTRVEPANATLEDMVEAEKDLAIVAKTWRRIFGDANDEMRDVMSCLRTTRKTIEDKAAAELASLEVAPAETVDLDLGSDCDVGID